MAVVRDPARTEPGGGAPGAPEPPLELQPETLATAEDLRRGVGRFVRAVRRSSGSERTAQSETLALLAREGELNVAGLAARRRVTHQTMRVVVTQLAADGLVRSRPDPSDARSRLVGLAPRGREAVEADRGARTASLAALMETALTAPQRRALQEAVALLDRLSDAAEG